jgi:hypothetical protein
MTSMRPQRPAAALICAAAAALLLIAAPALAATVSGSKIAKALKPALTAQQHTTATSVSCPSKVTVVAGGKFHCTATFSSGDKGPVKVRFKDSKGSYAWALQNLLVKKLEKTLTAAADKSGINNPDVTCPKVRKIEKGDEFICNAVGSDGNGGTFTVLQKGLGRVTYELSS